VLYPAELPGLIVCAGLPAETITGKSNPARPLWEGSGPIKISPTGCSCTTSKNLHQAHELYWWNHFCDKMKRPFPALARAGLAGAGGIEPPNGGIKIRCLTAWRRPSSAASYSQRRCACLGGMRSPPPEGKTGPAGGRHVIRPLPSGGGSCHFIKYCFISEVAS
jgi:hypothetical protein